LDRKDVLFQNYATSYVDDSLEKVYTSDAARKLNLIPDWGNSIKSNLYMKFSEVAKCSLLDYFGLEEMQNEECQRCDDELKNKEIILDFDKKYPVVKDLIKNIQNVETNNIIRMLQRIEENMNAIYGDFNISYNSKIVSIAPALGDYHGEKIVVELLFERGEKLIYKTRNGFGETLLNKILEALSVDLGEIYIQYTKEYPDFILQEFIKNDAFLNEVELGKFYWKFGFFASIFTFLGSNDLHAENIIATKKGPVFIDLETLISPFMNIYDYNTSAILNTYLFAGREPNNVYAGLDISGFSGAYNKQGHIGDSATKKFNNIPCNADGKEVNPYDYIDYVIKGFQIGEQLILEKKDIIEKGISSLIFGSNRKIIRNTAFYDQFIRVSLMPKYTKSFSEREELFNLLDKHSKYKEKIVGIEKEALSKLQVPFFELSVDNDNSELFDFALCDDLKSSLLERIRQIDFKFFEYEENILKQILSLKQPKVHLTTVSKLNIGCSRIEYECKKFLNYTQKNNRLVYSTVDDSVSEYIIDRSNDIYIFGGALLVLLLYDLKYEKIINIKQLILETFNSVDRGLSPVSGLLGVHSKLLLLSILQKFTNINELEKEMFDTLDELSDLTEVEICDFSTMGSSIIVCSKIIKSHYHRKLDSNLVKMISNYFYNTKKRKINTGLFHGYSGDMLVCLAIADLNKKDINKYYCKIGELLEIEDSLYSKEMNNWVDIRNGTENPHDMVALSYGAPGILLTRLILFNYFIKKETEYNDEILPILAKDIVLAINKIILMQREDFYDDTFINGYSGALLALHLAEKTPSLVITEELRSQIVGYNLNGKYSLESTKWRIQGSENIYFPNFMNGNMGIVFVLMILNNLLAKEEIGLWQK